MKALPKAKNQYAGCSGATSNETKESAVEWIKDSATIALIAKEYGVISQFTKPLVDASL